MLARGNGVCKGPVAERTHQKHPPTHPSFNVHHSFLSPAHWPYSWLKVRHTTKGAPDTIYCPSTSATVDGKSPASWACPKPSALLGPRASQVGSPASYL